MSKKKIIRAWKDEEYRKSLSEAERAQLPASPVGLVDLSDAELAGVVGGVLDLADPTQVAATSWKPMCRETASWICDYYPPQR
jgi:mersacidin/lichenicidin family type 2 lantibiotic